MFEQLFSVLHINIYICIKWRWWTCEALQNLLTFNSHSKLTWSCIFNNIHCKFKRPFSENESFRLKTKEENTYISIYGSFLCETCRVISFLFTMTAAEFHFAHLLRRDVLQNTCVSFVTLIRFAKTRWFQEVQKEALLFIVLITLNYGNHPNWLSSYLIIAILLVI